MPKDVLEKIIKKLNKLFFTFNPKINESDKKIKHLGTNYGGYDICVNKISNPIIISCGLGEDASFDIEMINQFNAKVFCVDPTPRAHNHYNEIKKRFGKKSEIDYNETGSLESKCYDLKKVNSENFVLLNKAIWSKNNSDLKLFYPKNSEFVSLSMNKGANFDEKNFFLAKTITIKEIIKENKLEKIDIIKLDIEGAEINVINNLLMEPELLPDQITVEFDLRRNPSLSSFMTLQKIHNKISKYFKLININQKGDFTYTRFY